MTDSPTKDPMYILLKDINENEVEFALDSDRDLCIEGVEHSDRYFYLSEDAARQLRDWLSKVLS